MKLVRFSFTSLLFFFLLDFGFSNPIDSEKICQHMEVLASDEFQGRKPGTIGERKTIEYIAKAFSEIGLEQPIENSYFQKVILAEYNVTGPAKIKLDYANQVEELIGKKDFLLASTYSENSIKIESAELIFAGFGIYAPEIGWDDYKGVDVSGKIVVVLSDVPGEYMEVENLWKGDPAANLYAKSFYKKNEAAKRGAIGLLTIYKQSQQGLYSWESLANYVGVDDLSIKRNIDEMQLKFSGLINRKTMEQLLINAQITKLDFQKEALRTDFKPVSLKAKISFTFYNKWETIETNNVLGLLPGTDLSDEVMIYSAHWDHVGIMPGASGDSIRNGAVDNASGTAALIELARAFKIKGGNRRSILFLATTAEEMGLLGAVWYNRYPIFPLGKTAANFNMDAHFPYGKSDHITGVVYGRSELDTYLEESARLQSRTLVPNTEQNISGGIFFRSDHFPFAEAGIPAEFAVGYGEAVGHDNKIYQQKLADYQYKYHQPSDEYEEDFDCSGIAEDAEFILVAGQLLDRAGAFPMWDKDQPFSKFRRASRFESAYFKDVSATNIPLIATQSNTMDAKTADVNRDGHMDLVLAGEYAYNMILIGDGTGKFKEETSERLPLKRHDSEDVSIADFDNDGDPDIVFVSEDDLINEYYVNDGKGYFTDQSSRLPVTGKSNSINNFDVNKDGYMDLVIGNEGVNFCLLNDTKGGWINSPDRIPQSSKTTQDIEVGDIDGDGDLDVLCGNEDDNEIWINDGTGHFTNETTKRITIKAGAWETREIDLGDIDGDGDLDVLLANVNFRQSKDHQNRLFINDGTGHFSDITNTNLPLEKTHSADGDFVDIDADGDLDIITGNGFGNSLKCYLNNGDGIFIDKTDEIVPASVRGDVIDVEALDFNGDGILDLYLACFRGSDVLLLGKLKR